MFPGVPAPTAAKNLVQTFEEYRSAYQSGGYKETEVRREFIDPLFAALGWDVANEAGKDPLSKDVVHEHSLRVAGQSRLPDYSFQIGGQPRFFVEAKKPSVNLKEGPQPALQIRSYSWSAQLPIGVLTDFEELAIYECRREPLATDSADTARLKYFRCDEYVERWDEIESLLSRDAVLAGSLERAVPPELRDARSVDDAFLAEIDSWRRDVARDLAARNVDLTSRELNYAVQQTIDRIIFLRVSEDRGIEPSNQLKDLIRPKQPEGGLYTDLLDLFRRADERYNSGLFHFSTEPGRTESPDALTPSLSLGNAVLRRILERLYYPQSAYRFAVFPPDALGHVYERFLGKVIEIGPKRQVTVEEKPEVRKAGGVYYTPTYVVRYIVSSALAGPLEGKTPDRFTATRKDAKPLRILDLACGSGSFLLDAYDFLLEWYLQQYVSDATRWSRSRPPRLREDPTGEWQLTATERRRILTTHIYGVDIDTQAVEVTKLSLLLKVLEGESDQTINQNLQLFHERALPDLEANVKCGNSLIGSDFFQSKLDSVGAEERFRINPFDWDQEFPDIVASGGFDVIVGNPPYRRELDYKHLLDDIAETDFGRRYRSARMDLWYYFVHRGLGLLRDGGTLAFIVNSYWTAGTGAKKLIEALRTEAHLDELFSLDALPVFAEVSGRHMIFRLTKGHADKPTQIRLAKPAGGEKSAEPFVEGAAPVESFEKSPEQLFRDDKLDLLPDSDGLIEKLGGWPALDQAGLIRQGIAENPADVNKKTNEKFGGRWKTGEGVFSLTPTELAGLGLHSGEKSLIRPYHDLQDIDRYWLAADPSRRLIYSTKETWPQLEENPALAAHLERFQSIMEKRRETQKGSNKWWHLHWPRKEELWEAPKVIALQMAPRPSFAPSPEPAYVPFSANVFVPDASRSEHLYFFAGILNSRLAWWWFDRHAKRRGVGLEINGNVLARFPMRKIDFEDHEDRRRHDQMCEGVTTRISLESDLKRASAHEATLIERQITRVEQGLDELVLELYSLSTDEAQSVEMAMPAQA
jgi:hypothetical protein